MFQSKSIVRRSVTSVLASLMVMGSFTVGGFGALAEESAELKLKTFTGSQLFEAAQAVDTYNQEDLPIYTSYQDAIGRRSLMPDNFMFHSVAVRHKTNAGELAYQDGDELKMTVRLMADDTYTSGVLFDYEFAFDAFLGRDDLISSLQIDDTMYDAAETRMDEITGLPYKEFSFTYDLNHVDFDDGTKEAQLRAMAKSPASVTVYFLGVYNTTKGTTVTEYDGVKLGAQAGIDGYYENIFMDDGTVSGVASYASDHERATGRDWHLSPYCFNAFGANREEPYLLLDGLGAALPAGEYSLGIEMSTMIALITLDKCIVSVYDGRDELASMVVTEDMVNATAGKDTGAYGEYRVPFTVEESRAGHNITFKVFLFDSNDIKIRSVKLYQENVTGPMPSEAQAVLDQINALTAGDTQAIQAARAALEQLDIVGQAWVGDEAIRKLSGMEAASTVINAITGLGSKDDLTDANYTEKTEALTAAEKLYSDFVKAYGKDAAEQMVTNAQALKDYRTAYNAAEESAKEKNKQAAIQAVEKLITDIGEVTQDNYASKKTPIDAAEDARAKLLADYGQAAVDAISNLDVLAEAKAKYEEYSKQPDVVYGDVNSDTKVEPADALQVLQYSVQLITLTDDQLVAADVDGNNAVNPSDALLILQYCVKMIDHFPVEN